MDWRPDWLVPEESPQPMRSDRLPDEVSLDCQKAAVSRRMEQNIAQDRYTWQHLLE